MHDTLVNVNKNNAIVDIFYANYFMSLMKDVLEVLTDGFHKSGFKMQTKIFFILIQVVTSNLVICVLNIVKNKHIERSVPYKCWIRL